MVIDRKLFVQIGHWLYFQKTLFSESRSRWNISQGNELTSRREGRGIFLDEKQAPLSHIFQNFLGKFVDIFGDALF